MSPTVASPETRWQHLVRTMLRFSGTALRAGADFALPPGCLCCGREPSGEPTRNTTLCAECSDALCADTGSRCRICAAPVGPYLDTTGGCVRCRHDKFHFDRVIRLGVYRDLLRSAVLQAKRPTGEALARTLADLLCSERCDDLDQLKSDVLVPVPHFWTRRFLPGHAASETLAERLAQRLRIPCHRGLLRKVRWTRAQAGSPPSVRRRQQRGAFTANKNARGLRILLIDDVLTTGATADEASKALLAKGAAAVAVAVVARGLGEHG